METINYLIEILKHLIDVILHLDKYLASFAYTLGPWLYALLFVIIFSETGLVVAPFLPGDSLLFAAGALAALPDSGINLILLASILFIAAILGDFVNYHVGKYLGPKVFRSNQSKIFNIKHLEYTQSFYEKYGSKTIILARFIPLVRTFAPFVAGIGNMPYSKFAFYNIVGGFLWVGIFIPAGYFFGNLPSVQRNFHVVIFAIIIVSALPALFQIMKAYTAKAALIALTAATFIFTPSSEARELTSYADVVEPALAGVVNIRTTNIQRRGDKALDVYQFFLNGKIPQSQLTHSVGSGIVLDKSGYILTNLHVIEDANAIEVLFVNGKQKYKAKVVGSDPKTDLVLLKVSPKHKLTPILFGDSDAIRITDLVFAIGNPFGFAHSVSKGIISAKSRVIGAGPYDDFLQTDALIHPGNSGGPLIDSRGRVIAINTAISRDGPGIGFAIPANLAAQVVKDIRAYGKVRRPWIGIVAKNILSQEDLEESTESKQIFGVIVSNLIVEGPAYKIGLKIGDLITQIDDQKIADINHMQRMLVSMKPSDEIKVRVYRRSKGFFLTKLKLEETPKSSELPAEKDLF